MIRRTQFSSLVQRTLSGREDPCHLQDLPGGQGTYLEPLIQRIEYINPLGNPEK